MGILDEVEKVETCQPLQVELGLLLPGGDSKGVSEVSGNGHTFCYCK
jgi:hypothetical protein